MKKIIILLSCMFLLAVTAEVNAQCTPNASQTAFFIPDTAVNFQPAFDNIFYEQILYVAVPTQTSVYINPPGVWLPITIDTLRLVNITGLPACISYENFPNNPKFPGGSKACIRFYGTPALSDTGVYHLTINSVFDGVIFSLDTVVAAPLVGYRLPIFNHVYYGVQNTELPADFSLSQNTPNPFSDQTNIVFTSKGNENVLFEVFDVLGSKVFEQRLSSVAGTNTFRFSAANLTAGIYFYRMGNAAVTFTRKMTISSR